MEKELRFLVTNQCNYNCVFCHNEGQEKKFVTKELSVQDYVFIFKIFKDSTGLCGVTISGGEPFTFKDIDILVKSLYDEGAEITIVSNGALALNHINCFNFIKRLNISIHSLNNKNYNLITQTKNKLKDVKTNLRYIRQNFPNLDIRLNATPTKISNWSIKTLEKIIDFSKSINASVKLTELFPNSSENCINKTELLNELKCLKYKFVSYNSRALHFEKDSHSVYVSQCTCSKASEFKNPREYCSNTRDYYVNHDGGFESCMFSKNKDFYLDIINRNDTKISNYFLNNHFLISEKKCKMYLNKNIKSLKEKIFMENEKIIDIITNDIKVKFTDEGSGHDWWHIKRVLDLSITLNKKENGNEFIIKMIALMHDLFDDKFSEGDPAPKLKNYLSQMQVIEFIQEDDLENIIHSIKYLGFKGGFNKEKLSKEGQIVQDADRIDAIGAIGIARCFTYGGSKGRVIYDPDIGIVEIKSEEEYRSNKKHSLNHFYEKLLKLKNTMNTQTGKQIAEERTVFMERYLEEFYDEWDGKK